MSSNIFKVNNQFICPKILHIEPNLENINPSETNRLPIFGSGSKLFIDYGRLWCLNRENQHNCKSDENYFLTPKIDVVPNENYPYKNDNFNYSNNIISELIGDRNVNIGRKFNATGTNVNSRNEYREIDTTDNPYPYNVDFTPDSISLEKINRMNIERIRYCNNRTIENRWRPVYLHTPKRTLEIGIPKGFKNTMNVGRVDE